METIFLPQRAMMRRDMEMTDRCDVLGRLDGVGDGTCEGIVVFEAGSELGSRVGFCELEGWCDGGR